MQKASDLRKSLIKGGATAGRAEVLVHKATRSGEAVDDEPREVRSVLPGYWSWDKETQKKTNRLIHKLMGREVPEDEDEDDDKS